MQQLIIPVLATLALIAAVLTLLGSSLVPPVYTVDSRIELMAGPEESWELLSSIQGYAAWNPYITRAEGVLQNGETLSLTLIDENFDGPIVVRPTVGEVDPPRRFYWTGRVGLPGLFDTKHVFELLVIEGETTLHHYEEFRGVVAALWPNRTERSAKTQSAFEAMNTALKVELAQQSSK